MMRGGGSVEEEMAKSGLPRKLVEKMEGFRPVEIWPDQVEVVNLFSAVLTQWRMGPTGPVGLDYAGVESVMRMRMVPAKERGQMLDDLRIMERAALAAIRE